MTDIDKKALKQARHAFRSAQQHGDGDEVALEFAIEAYLDNATIVMDGGEP